MKRRQFYKTIKTIVALVFVIGIFLLVGAFMRQYDRDHYPVITKGIETKISFSDGKMVLPSGAFVKGILYEYIDEEGFADNPIVEGKKTFNQKIVKGDATIYWSQDQYLAAMSDNK